MILVTPKQEVERKSEWFCGVKFVCSKFKVEWENGVWTKIRFLASGFLFTCGNFTLIFTVFFDFLDRIFFLNGFHNPFIVRSWSSFLSMKILWIVRQDLSCYVFFTSSNRFLFRLTLTSWNWLFQWITSLKNDFWTHLWINLMNIYLLKVNSVHLSSAKHICPNSWLLVLSFWFRILILGTFLFVPPSTLCAPSFRARAIT